MISSEQFKKEYYKPKNYAHFDRKLKLDESVWGYITDQNAIAKHGFYPFICDKIVFNKYVKDKETGLKVKKIKERPIAYASHIDRTILQYYNFKIMQNYEQKIKENGLDDVVIAYRRLSKSNIEFSKIAFDFIKKNDTSLVIIGDFEGFFDNLEHNYLKEMMCRVLDVEKLPDDYYNIFKNITKFSTWELTSLLKLNDISYRGDGVHLSDYVCQSRFQAIRKLNKQDKVLSTNEFKRYKKQYMNKGKNRNQHGIPQGSPISATLANIYMLEFDTKINEFIKKYNGLYMRYSDDFIIVIPSGYNDIFKEIYNFLFDLVEKTKGLSLQKQKTKLFRFVDKNIFTVSDQNFNNITKSKIDYLGFEFDGEYVYLREKTITKYHYKLYRKIRTIQKSNGYTKKGNKINNQQLYEKYSIKGVKIDDSDYAKRNFLSYVNRAEKIYGKNEKVNIVKKRHLTKIRKELKRVNYKKSKYKIYKNLLTVEQE